MHRRILTPLLILSALVGVTDAAAQEASSCTMAAALASDSSRYRPDLLIRASAQMRSLRFESEPAVRVNISGCAAPDPIRVTERTNLPQPVRAGVTYTDVRVGVEIASHLDVRCLLPALAAVGADTIGAPAAPLLTRLCALAGRDSVRER